MAATWQRPREEPRADADDWIEEQQDWLDALDDVLRHRGPDRVRALVARLQAHVSQRGLVLTDATLNTPYKNTIDLADQPAYPGDLDLETAASSNIIRWNAVAMVLQAYDSGSGVGGHIATYLSAPPCSRSASTTSSAAAAKTTAATRCTCRPTARPASMPAPFSRAGSARRSSTISAASSPRAAACLLPASARLPDSGRCPPPAWGCRRPRRHLPGALRQVPREPGPEAANGGKIWTFIGDGEADEPEVLGTINIASRERLDNLVLVVNCNLQRLDGPVRGNGKIIQELERSFRGADWHVIKVIWGSGWDPILDRDVHGLLQQRMEQAVDGDYQMYTVSSGDVVREHWVGERPPSCASLMQSLTDEEIRSIKRGGHDHRKIYAAFQHAAQVSGKPCVILLKTVKGDGLGLGGGQQHVHQKKYLSRGAPRSGQAARHSAGCRGGGPGRVLPAT
jgi:pyruvate dehydrogenase E1 component